ncbi:hypothetical protein BVG16_09820 [Paenibacillus selenitireducens]|uniref:ABC transporter substrate-binding protein n=1 Tax=Paenibacillus selenitireducens TaxID=1324314 RepID=A0A1T2XHM8_9BACL|nr:ABC transporter substrate-binding protein [Paenibacillus selenitireducens]OPA79370.1 hypothetical protein BVG16_09820 [Paenibacillus selenitireducens]
MQMIERYTVLFDKFGSSDGKVGMTAEVSLEQLAETLYCTVRNVKLIIRRLEEEGWIQWQAGRGRGNLSRLTFLADKDNLVLEHAQQHAERGEYKQAFDLLHAYSEETQVKSKFMDWLDTQFGYRTESWQGKNEADMLRFPVYRPINTLDTGELVYAFDSHMARQIFDRLVQYDAVRSHFSPSIAHTWEHNEDASVWTFYLRKGIQFHHGRELVAEDVVFTLERLRTGKIQSWMMRTLDRVEKLSDYAVRIHLTRSNWLFLRFLCSASLSILPWDLGGLSEEHYWRLPLGTGPFRIIEWTENQCVLQAHHAYFQGRPHLDGVIIAFIPDEKACQPKDTQWPRLMYGHDHKETTTDAEWKRIEWLSRGCNLIHWNMRKDGPQRSLAFRRALDLLLDRQRMIQELGEDRMYPARGFYPDDNTPYEHDMFDPDYALTMLREAGYDGKPITIMTRKVHEIDLLWLQQYFAEFGITIEVQIETWQSIRHPDILMKADGILNEFVLAEEEVCLLEMYEQEGGLAQEFMPGDFNRWISSRIDRTLECQNAAERWVHLSAIERRIHDEGVILFLLHKNLNTQFHQSVRGVGMNSLGWIDFKDVWVAAIS